MIVSQIELIQIAYLRRDVSRFRRLIGHWLKSYMASSAYTRNAQMNQRTWKNVLERLANEQREKEAERERAMFRKAVGDE